MGVGAFIEPLVVVTLLFGGTYINRNTNYSMSRAGRHRRNQSAARRDDSPDSLESGMNSPTLEEPLLDDVDGRASSPSLLRQQEPKWRKREIRILGMRKEVTSPNTRVFKDRLLSRLLQKLPFLVEAWYWGLIYWVYQLGRAFTAVNLVDEGTVNVARRHALQVIHLEQRLHIFLELPIQRWFLQHPFLMLWTNRIYSFIHIPGTILFLIWLYYYTTTTRNQVDLPEPNKPVVSSAGPKLYEARRRTLAVCNLVAFIVFTIWPCMPPRLLSDPVAKGPEADEGRSYGFVDTVHGENGESSVWTQNRFCNQYAAMPSLHFGYSLLIGLTILTIPLSPAHSRSRTLTLARGRLRTRLPSPRRLLCLLVGIAYPLTILIAIIATANHFVLDAVAGALVCGVAWSGNGVLLALMPVEDWFLWGLGICKPVRGEGGDEDEGVWEGSWEDGVARK